MYILPFTNTTHDISVLWNPWGWLFIAQQMYYIKFAWCNFNIVGSCGSAFVFSQWRTGEHRGIERCYKENPEGSRWFPGEQDLWGSGKNRYWQRWGHQAWWCT